MNTINNLVQIKTAAWFEQNRNNSQSLPNTILKHIETAGNLRLPQIQAVQTWLWLKFAGENRCLASLIRDGLLFDESTAVEYRYFRNFEGNFIAQFLSQFFQDNNLNNLMDRLLNDPNGDATDWDRFLNDLLHNFPYPNYLFSLPMGAGKTFLMACFIYIDLYLANLFKEDARFAHNFVVLAPQASKTAILPSLRTIRDFNPLWLFPKDEALNLKKIVHIEILDNLSSKRKDKLHGNNPNLEKVNRIRQTRDFALVFITNAEKVVLERYSDSDRKILAGLELYEGKKEFFNDRDASDIKKSNELREALSHLPHLGVILDEVHHSYGSTGHGEKKLREAVEVLNQHGNVNAVTGLSGTPYVKSSVELDGKKLKLNQIQDIVYNYPLDKGIGRFLKIPTVKKSNIQETHFLEQALTDFFSHHDVQYHNGALSKMAIYCPSVKKLNEEVLPAVREWYSRNRPDKQDEIFRYYSRVSKENKSYELPRENLSIFNNLDKPYSAKRVILLVAVGTEGWDCRSLTAVVLPRQRTAKNFVLQTTCRCLRQVDDASHEKALIYLSGDNYDTLNRELKDNYRLSIDDLSLKPDRGIRVQVRKKKLGRLKYKQVEAKSKIVKRSSPDVRRSLDGFLFERDVQKRFPYVAATTESQIGTDGLIGERSYQLDDKGNLSAWTFDDFLYGLTLAAYGLFSESELTQQYGQQINNIYSQLKSKVHWISLHSEINMDDVLTIIASLFMDRVECAREITETQTEIELLEWASGSEVISLYSPNGTLYKFMPRFSIKDARTYQRHPEDLLEDFFSERAHCDPMDLSYNYVPYKMDSTFEQNALTEILKLSEVEHLEVYFNGFKDARLQSFWIQTPRGRYTPDFLILQRQNNRPYSTDENIPIDKILIIETKGAPYNTDDFRAKERFVREEFLKHNRHFRYHCFVDDGKNDFTRHLDDFRKIIQDFQNEK